MTRFIDDFRVLPEMLERTARLYPDREAYRWYEFRTNAWVSLPWREFSERVLRWRRAFARMGFENVYIACTEGNIKKPEGINVYEMKTLKEVIISLFGLI